MQNEIINLNFSWTKYHDSIDKKDCLPNNWYTIGKSNFKFEF